MNKYNVAIIGATGIVGETLLTLLAERDFPVDTIFPLASHRSAGESVVFKGKPAIVEDVADFDFSKVHFAFFSAGAEVSLQYAPIAAEAGCTVIDNTSAYRYKDEVPLIVPEVNPEVLLNNKHTRIIANPNCSTIQMVLVLKPIFDACGIERVNVATYQSVSGAGNKAIKTLAKETADLLNGQPPEAPLVFSDQIAFNVLPHIDVFEENGYTREEMKMVWETRKILQAPSLAINPTAVRVPVFFGHAEALHIELEKSLPVDALKSLLAEAPGVKVIDDQNQRYPTPVSHAANQDLVFVGRIRKDISHENGVNLWVVADNVRKGAALNAIQIAELLAHNSFYKH